jgi:two-component system sensor kinase FixL
MGEAPTSARTGPGEGRTDLLEAAFEAAVDAMVVIDRHGVVLSINSAVTKIFGYSRSELLGENVSVLMPEPYRSEHAGYLVRYLATLEPRIIGIGREVEGQRKDGSVFPLDLAVGEASAMGDRLFVGILRDLSDRRKLQSELEERRLEARRHRERLAHVDRISTLGQMAAGIAHEVNQPLGAISNYAQAARLVLQAGQETLDPAKVDSILEKISAQALRAGEVIRRIRTLARDQQEEIVAADLNELVLATVELARIEAVFEGAEVATELEEPLPQVLIDPIQIQQVILNLVRNGLESMRLANQQDCPIRLNTRAEGEHVTLEVIDSGTGIADDLSEHILTPFVSSKQGGMGMGLAISESIVANHEGRLWFRNNDSGSGATFGIELPRADRGGCAIVE